MNKLSPKLAQRIIQQLGGSGQPPDYGVQYFSVGLDDYLNVIDEEYLSSYILDGGSIFKLVEGIYGGGKTHFLYCVRDKGWAHGFVASYISLKTGGECPFDRLDLVYKAVAGGLLPPIDQEDPNVRLDDKKGLQNFLQHWYATRLRQLMDQGKSGEAARMSVLEEEIESISAASIHSTSFRYAVEHALRALVNGDTLLFDEICQWLKGEAPPTARLKALRIVQKLDKSTAFSWIRSLNQVMRVLGYSGLVILLDEAERVASMGTKQREQLLSNLRELIDECGKSDFQHIMIFYAVPDRSFLDGRTAVYEALNQRLSTTFDYYNHSGVAIKLDNSIPDRESFLRQVGAKIVDVYSLAYSWSLPSAEIEPVIQDLAEQVIEERFADDGYKRIFVQRLVGELNKLRRQPSAAPVQVNG